MNRKKSLFGVFVLMLFVVGLSAPAAAAKKFITSDDAKQKDEPQAFLKDYDKLLKGSEADWVYFAEGFKAANYKTVMIKAFEMTGKGPQVKEAAESGPDYYDTWITSKSDIGWKVVKGGSDLILMGNIVNAWEPSGAARYWGGWMANPGACQELIGKDSKGNILFQIRHKSRGSTVPDAIENGIENILKTLGKGK
jgi:hypothetical protein